MQKFVTIIEKGEAAVSATLPELTEQILAYGVYKNTLGLLFWAGITLPLFLLGAYNLKVWLTETHPEEQNICGAVFGLGIAIAFLIPTFIHALYIVQIKVAPYLYLLDEVKQLLGQ